VVRHGASEGGGSAFIVKRHLSFETLQTSTAELVPPSSILV